MEFQLPALPYEKKALEPHLSAERVTRLYDGLHRDCVTQLNQRVADSIDADKSLEALLHSTSGELFELAAQAWNLTFYWHCLAPKGGSEPSGPLGSAIGARYGGVTRFQQALNTAALSNDTAQWSWLVQTAGGSLAIIDSDCPMALGHHPLLVVEATDHLDERRRYLQQVWHVINWDFIAQNFSAEVT